jgi:anti-sigma B factor antagonist
MVRSRLKPQPARTVRFGRVNPRAQAEADAMGSDLARFSLDTSVQGDRCELVVAGDIDVHSADQVAALGLLHLTDANLRSLVVDLSAVTFIDSSGIGALVRIRNVALEFDKHLALRNPSERVQKVLNITALDEVFEIW